MPTPLERQTVPAVEWGAPKNPDVPWADDPKYKPQIHIVHYGGGANPAGTKPYSRESEEKVLRAWWSWHVNGKGMRAIAYNKCIGQTGTLYDGRTDRHSNGGQYGQINYESRAVVFILGGDQIPSPAARRTFGRLWLEHPFAGKVDRHLDWGDTSCPGTWLSAWVRRQGWIEDLGTWSLGDESPVVSSIKVRLHRIGYRLLPGYGPRFNRALRRQITRFQRRQGIRVDGVAGPETLRALGGLLGEIYPDTHDDPYEEQP